jgi:hypothetical protein
MNKQFITTLILALEVRINQIFNKIQANPSNFDLDTILIDYLIQLDDLCKRLERAKRMETI